MTQLNRKRLLASAFAISAAIVLTISLSTIGCMDGDDWTISCMLSGKYENSTLCLFVNALLSQFILMLGAAMPDVNWFFVFERGVVWLSLSLIVYSAFLSGRRFSMQWTILAIYVVLLLPGCLLGSNYTFVAAASAISGELWILQALFSQNTVSNSRALSVLSGALIIVGCLMRLGAMLLTLPFFGLAFVCLSRKYKNKLKTRKMIRASLILAVLGAMCAVSVFYDGILWNANEQLQEWDLYNTARGQLSDFPTPEYSEIAVELSQLKLSNNDWWFVNHWATADPNVFSVDVLKNLDSIQNDFNLHRSLFPDYFAYLLRDKTLLMATAITLLSVFAMKVRKCLGGFVGFVFIALAFCGYFYWIGRLPDRVEYPIFASALLFFCATALISSSFSSGVPASTSMDKTGKSCGMLVFALSAASLFAWVAMGVGACAQTHIEDSSGSRESEVLNYIEECSDKVFWWDTYSMQYYQQLYGRVTIPPAGSLASNFKMGGWTTTSPQTEYAKEIKGVSDGIGSLATNSSALLISTQGNEMPGRVLEFLRQHYAFEGEMKKVDQVYDGSLSETFEIWEYAP